MIVETFNDTLRLFST